MEVEFSSTETIAVWTKCKNLLLQRSDAKIERGESSGAFWNSVQSSTGTSGVPTCRGAPSGPAALTKIDPATHCSATPNKVEGVSMPSK